LFAAVIKPSISMGQRRKCFHVAEMHPQNPWFICNGRHSSRVSRKNNYLVDMKPTLLHPVQKLF